jgi:gamma-glutamylcyclotransferase (GGCT)/AIG2-like uncharacterized protein YtfP
MTLHFAFGSNMSRSLMRAHAAEAQPIGAARLTGYRFIITRDGYASVVPAAGETVHGVLWRLTPRDLAALNAYESIESGLYRRAVLPVWREARREAALVYVARERGEGRPRPGYLDLVIAAARDWDLPESYIRSLQRWAPTRWRGARAAETGELG